MAELKPVNKALAGHLRDFADWAALDTNNRVELRSLLDAYVYKCNNRLARHKQGEHVQYYPRDIKQLPIGWEWCPETLRS